MIRVGIYKSDKISQIELPTGIPFVINFEEKKFKNFEYLS